MSSLEEGAVRDGGQAGGVDSFVDCWGGVGGVGHGDIVLGSSWKGESSGIWEGKHGFVRQVWRVFAY